MSYLRTITCLAALSLLGIACHSNPPPQHAAATACPHQCPMHEAAALSDVKVQTTEAGATIELVAKRPEDASKVQQHAQQMAAMLSSGQCPMHGAQGGMHHEHHQHHQHHQHPHCATPPCAGAQ